MNRKPGNSQEQTCGHLQNTAQLQNVSLDGGLTTWSHKDAQFGSLCHFCGLPTLEPSTDMASLESRSTLLLGNHWSRPSKPGQQFIHLVLLWMPKLCHGVWIVQKVWLLEYTWGATPKAPPWWLDGVTHLCWLGTMPVVVYLSEFNFECEQSRCIEIRLHKNHNNFNSSFW